MVMYYPYYLPAKKREEEKKNEEEKSVLNLFFQDPIDFHPVSVNIILNIFKIK